MEFIRIQFSHGRDIKITRHIPEIGALCLVLYIFLYFFLNEGFSLPLALEGEHSGCLEGLEQGIMVAEEWR